MIVIMICFTDLNKLNYQKYIIYIQLPYDNRPNPMATAELHSNASSMHKHAGRMFALNTTISANLNRAISLYLVCGP